MRTATAAALGTALVVVAAWFLLGPGSAPDPGRDRGPSGIDFVVPPDYRVLPLGESTPQAAARALTEALAHTGRAAAVFTHDGDRIQLLIDVDGDMIDQRIMGREGTVRRVLWRGPVRERLLWAEANGDLAAPGLSAPDQRNPYH